MLKYFKILYSKVIYKSLDKLQAPYIFAYSAFVDEQVNKQTKESGFDGCFDGKLTKHHLKMIIKENIRPFAEQVVHSNLENLQKIDLMMEIMDEVELA